MLPILAKEIQGYLLSLRFAALCVVCPVMLLASAILFTGEYQQARGLYADNANKHHEEISQHTQGMSLTSSVKVDRPVNPMSIFVGGITPHLTEVLQMGNLRFSYQLTYRDRPLEVLFPSLDYPFIMGVIMSLFAVAFSYNLVSGEREDGTITILLSYSVSRNTILLGKWLGGYLAMVLPLLLGFFVALLSIELAFDLGLTAETWSSLAGLLTIALLYLGAIYSLGLLVSCRTDNSATSIAVALLLWVVLVLGIPNLAPFLASLVSPIPARGVFDRQATALEQDYSQALGQLNERSKAQKGNEYMEDQDFRAESAALKERMAVAMQRIAENYAAKVQQQTRISETIARLSPYGVFKLAALDIAAQGPAAERRFVEALRIYQQTWKSYSDAKRRDALIRFKQTKKDAGEALTEHREHAFLDHWEVDLYDYPRFPFSYMGLQDRLNEAAVDLLLLAIWNIVLFLFSYVSFMRLEIR